MDYVAERAQSHASFDRCREFRDDLAGVARDNRRTYDLIAPLFHVHFDEAVGFSVQHRAIHLFQFLLIGRDRDSALLRLGCV